MELSLSSEKINSLKNKIKPLDAAIQIRPEGEIAFVEFDLPGEKANKLSSVVLMRLLNVIESLSSSKYKCVVFISKKPNIFIAGADIEEIKGIKTKEEASEAAAFGQSIFTLLEALPMPTVAAINGACMGGGTEFILACDYRIASNDPSTKIALPEVLLGIYPGFGGTQRLPRLIGLQQALDMILTGRSINGTKAQKIGLLDLCVPKEIMHEQVLKFAKDAINKGKRKKYFQPKGLVNKILEGPAKSVIFSQAKKTVLKQTKGHYPAPLKALEVIKKTYGGSFAKGMRIEAEGFGEVAATEVSKNLIGLFFMTEAVKKQTGLPGNKKIEIPEVKSVGVLGAGTMGGGIAQLAADKGMSVRVKDVTLDAIAKGLKTAADLFNKEVKKKKITKYDWSRKMAHISGGTDYAGFKELDVVVEAIVEDLSVKQKVLADMAAHYTKPNAIIASNTSSLSITEIGSALPNQKNFVGMHFFNPVNKMPLIEVIRGTQTSDEATATIFSLSKKMGKTPIVVKDGAGFLVNRLLLPYLNEACYVFAEGVSVESIDKALLDFGMPMGPLHLIDEVGIDVCAKVSKILHKAYGVRAEAAPVMQNIVDAKKLGKKNGTGFYLYDSAGKKLNVDPNIHQIAKVQKTSDKYTPNQIVERVLYPMINEAALCLQEKVVEGPQEVDLGMIMGTGFPPFRGGLLKWADSVGAQKVVSTLTELEKKNGAARFSPSAPLKQLAQSGGKFYS